MGQYQFPYLSDNQTRPGEVTAWQQELANAIESVFSKGAVDLPDVVAGLNKTRVKGPNGEDWTEASFTAVMHELGA
jgi:hypothetical protein